MLGHKIYTLGGPYWLASNVPIHACLFINVQLYGNCDLSECNLHISYMEQLQSVSDNIPLLYRVFYSK